MPKYSRANSTRETVSTPYFVEPQLLYPAEHVFLKERGHGVAGVYGDSAINLDGIGFVDRLDHSADKKKCIVTVIPVGPFKTAR
jgi:hypothetical protein